MNTGFHIDGEQLIQLIWWRMQDSGFKLYRDGRYLVLDEHAAYYYDDWRSLLKEYKRHAAWIAEQEND